MIFPGKQGSIVDIFFVLVVLFMGAFTGVILYDTWESVSPQFNDTVQGMGMVGDDNKMIISDGIARADEGTQLLDYLFVALFVGFLISILITSFLVDTHPAFFVVYIVVMIFAVIMSVMFSNGFETFSQTNAVASTVDNNFSMTAGIMTNLPVITLVTGLLGMVIMFAKTRSQDAP